MDRGATTIASRTSNKTEYLYHGIIMRDPARPPRLFGLFGDPVCHSLSPVMQNSAFAHAEYNAVYLPFKVRDIKKGVSAIRTLGIAGASVTMPHKSSITDLLDELDESAKKIGAANTVVNRDGALCGYNTDISGAANALSEKILINGKSAAVIGAGGAAAAIAFGMILKGAEVAIASRSSQKGERLASRLGADFLPLADIKNHRFDIVANATPIGMTPGDGAMPIPKSVLKKGMTIMDAVYNPRETALIKAAGNMGCSVVDGAAMFVFQGAAQFELWTGLKAPVGVMKKAVLKALSKNGGV